MNQIEAVEMMKRCREEIRQLQATVGRLQPKAEAYDAITNILGLLPRPSRPSQGYGVDIVWQLTKAIDAAEANAASPPKRMADMGPMPISDEPGGADPGPR